MKRNVSKSFWIIGVVATVLISGCSQRTSCEVDDAISKQSVKDIEVAKLQTKIASKNDVIIKKSYEMFPPNAEAGECYTRVMIPEKYKIVKQKVLVKEASTKLIKIPAKFKVVYKNLLVKEASTKLVTTKPIYKSVVNKVLVKEADTKVITKKPIYGYEKEKILVTPTHTEWKVGKRFLCNAIKHKSNATGEVICLVKVPACYKIVNKRVVLKPACTITKQIPAQYKLVTKKVLLKPACTITKTIPAVYKKVATKELVTPATTKTIVVPAQYKYINKKVKVKDSELKWMPILCETNFTMPRIMMVQRALMEAGFNPGPIDGVFGDKTKIALRDFQKSKCLATGALTISTLRALGVYK